MDHFKGFTKSSKSMFYKERKYTRKGSKNIVAYICMDDELNEISQGLGVTVDVGAGGIKIELPKELETDRVRLFTVGKDDDLVDVNGFLRHSEGLSNGKYMTGIEFNSEKKCINKFLEGYTRRLDHEMFIS